MEMTRTALRVIEIVLTVTTILALLSIMWNSTGRRLTYVGAFAYLLHALLYEIAILVVTSDTASDRTAFYYWVIGLRIHATSIILIYGIYFSRLFTLRNLNVHTGISATHE